MTHWRTLGSYLGRDVKIADGSTPEQIKFNRLETSVLLLVLGVEIMTRESGRALLKALVDRQPLAIMVYGNSARAVFDALIAELADGATRKHVMTRITEDVGIETAVEVLLQSTWPSEDRFDDWKEYAIVSVGEDMPRIEGAVRKLCD